MVFLCDCVLSVALKAVNCNAMCTLQFGAVRKSLLLDCMQVKFKT